MTKPAQLIAERFEIDRLAGAGGMGIVYRALDRQTARPVALKMLARLDATALERFAEEARILAELDHPRIVRYVAHGRTPAGQYLAMEWLDGETLGERLLRGRLAIGESLALVERAAGALAAVHARGMVHRDIKPGNLFLVGGLLEDVKLLDFGIARHGVSGVVSLSGGVVGTPGYVAPEQAQGTQRVDARADVFALGAVLYECLTGRPPFLGGNVMAVLAKILLDEAPRAGELVDDLPPAVDALLARMLAKDPALRPRDGAALVEELRGLAAGGAVAASAPPALTTGEQRLLSVILARRGEEADTAEQPDLRAAAEAHGAVLEQLADGSLVVTLEGKGAATDQAARAARCALALRPLLPDVSLALATGRGMVALRFPVGEAIDAAARLLDEVAGAPALRIDETTAGLLDARFEIGGDRHGLELLGERDDVDDARTLLGKRTPFVGRERELAFLVGLYQECAGEPRARPVLVTGPAGSGKSRLAQELRVRLPRSAQVWRARGDPGGAGSPFGMLAPALRRTAGILDGEPLELRQMKLRARVARHLGGEAVTRVSEFIGELVGARFDNGQRIELQAARRDLVLMGDQMRRAFEDWVAAETAGAPLVLVLEDLQWGDLPTVKFVDAALRHAADRPLLVVALARPEVHQLFPALWAERGVQELRLGELTRRSSERLVRAALGDAADETVAQLCDRAAGNPLYLEELIRAVSEGRSSLPPTVLAMVAARLAQLEPEARRILRAASVFGQLFWHGGVEALLGGPGGEPELPEWLDILVSREVLVRRAERRFPGEHDYAFRHALVRDAAYALLTDADRTLGHGLAASWLRQAGEEDPVVLAEHLAAGPPEGRPRAAVQLARAAEQALEGNDLAAAVLRAEGGLALATDDATRGRLLLALADARSWLGEFADAEEAAAEALVRLPRASAAWLKAVAQLAVACVRRGNLGRVMPLVDELLAVGAPADPEALAALVESGARTANLLLLGGRRELGTALLAGIARIAADAPGPVGPAAAATLLAARATEALYAGMPDACHELSQAAAASYLEAGALRLACVYKSNAAFACIEGGALAEAEAVLRELLPLARRLGTPNILASAQHNLGHVLAQRGALDEAVAHEREAVAILCAQGDRRLEGSARLYLAYALERGGEAAAAEAEAERAVELLSVVPPLRAHALAALAGLRLLAGRALEARTLVEQALAILAELGSLEEGESRVRLVDVETLEALGRRDEARAALAVAAARVLARAEKIRGPWRRSFLALPDNARTLELARARGV